MFVLIKDNTITKRFNLDKDIEYEGICIYSKNNLYYIDLKNGLYFDDDSKSKLLSIGSYNIKKVDVYYHIGIYVYESDLGIDDYKLYETANFIIACNDKANIICKDAYLNGYYLVYKAGYLLSNYEIIVNSRLYDGSKLKNNDVIEFLGIRIIYNESFIYINSFNIDIHLKPYTNYEAIVRYKNEINVDNYYILKDYEELIIDDLEEYKVIKKESTKDFIKSFLPNIVMCISMSLMALTNYYNNSSSTSIISYIIMPTSMLITSVLIPLIFIVIGNITYKRSYKKNKEDYLKYLDEYSIELNSRISKYIEALNDRYFSLINSKGKLFYASKKSEEFLKLSLGKCSISKDISFKKTLDNEIDEKIIEIENTCNNIDNYPLFLDLNEKHIVSIVSKSSSRYFLFNKFLLELAYKHHYDDIYIGIYAKDNNIFNPIYNLPHLFKNNLRITINNLDDLQILDQQNLDRPLILFMYDRCDYTFSNSNIRVLYFTDNIAKILKDSDAIVDYTNIISYIYDGQRRQFTYIKEDINFNDYFSYLGKFKSINLNDNRYAFSKIFPKGISEYYACQNKTLKATFAYNNSELISLDLHESKQGPHGLIGGSTGSGKSEFIVSLLLSLCIRYYPEYLNIVLIDYKGGGIKESLSFNGKSIPHIIASISNLENNVLERLIIALGNKCKARQELFRKLSNISNTSIMNIDDYLDCNTKHNFPNMAHLLIVVDEFAELKKENPEQIKQLISISRVGRSLGIHLILATQKPSGVIDDEIWSNSRFKIALKVFDEKDSMDIIKCKDAAYINEPGTYMSLIDNSLIKGKAIYSKMDMNGNDPYNVSLLDNKLAIEKTYKKQVKQIVSEASYFVNKINETCIKNNYLIDTLDYLTPLPKSRKDIALDNIVLGEIDDYINDYRDILKYSIDEDLLIYSSRKKEINSLLNTLNENGRKCIVIAKDSYEGKYILDSISYDDNEDIEFLFDYLINHKDNNLTLLVDDINCLLSYNETYLETICKLIKRRDALNISFIFICVSPQINIKLVNLFKNKIMINIVDTSDITFFYGARTSYKGNSFCFSNGLLPFVPTKIEEYINSPKELNSIIKRIPEIIEPEVKDDMYLIGYDIKTKEKVYVSNIDIYSFNSEYLDIYNVYPKLNKKLYGFSINSNSSNILWLGQGIFNQRLFITGLKDDLKTDEGILILNNRKTIIRRLSNV